MDDRGIESWALKWRFNPTIHFETYSPADPMGLRHKLHGTRSKSAQVRSSPLKVQLKPAAYRWDFTEMVYRFHLR
jgi:hypothetical protein